jgi:hypothetical protein
MGGGLCRGDIFDVSSFLIISFMEKPIDLREFDVVAIGRDGR